MNAPLRVLLAFLAGLAGGILVEVPALARAIEPVGQLWVNAIRMPIIPLLMALTISGIAGAETTREAGRLSTRALVVFLVILVTSAAIATPLAVRLLDGLSFDPAATASLRASAGVDGATVARLTLRDWVTSLVPSNPLKAMADGALLPLVVFAVCYGLALTRTAPATRAAQLGAARGVADVLLVLIGWVLALAPVGVFALAWTLGATVGLPAAGAVVRYLLATTATVAAAAVLLVLVTSVLARVPLMRLVRALGPALLIAATTRSSLAALPAVLSGLRSGLAVRDRVIGVVVPIAASLFKPNSPWTWPFGAMLVARLYGVELDAGQWAVFALGSVLLSFTTPGIPSGGFFVQAPLYAAVGLPAEGLGILIALDLLPDIAKTALNVTSYASSTVLVDRWEQPDVVVTTSTTASSFPPSPVPSRGDSS
ncbi:MAG: dicarboxylate/amino acid:cation symporter [Gemmatimonadaceae bacterium]|jgi:Na+/H+-dicarboxylate symporter|nr:dicarboxylate/amino acid:cation symporter [Gemmatimonadaceae bacterium]